ncbi:NAD(P)-binding protein [Schizophyllum commune H4-8]|uniref:NAD(P)-binding protein n=1 Tax=Schizophyllum commune (strain H4-8 / FGSC 9210) TaxID=578458 RepID=UPI00215E7A3A|nr:NAD(P)-binding protein [Schizophyllum commune H4-8]KAI5890553.1 NAD(P)-binding protein [Schizophyllum commune H4-8]
MAASNEPTVYLVSGANRGIGMVHPACVAERAHASTSPGLAIVTLLASRSDAIVFAGARSPESADKLHALSRAHPGRVHVVKLVSADRADNDAAVEEIKRTAGHLNVVIANAGISDCFKDALAISPEEMTRHFEVNTNGPLVLFQATYPLLRASKAPKFAAVTSHVGSIAGGTQLENTVYAYGASKAALNWVTRKLHFQYPEITIFPIAPGGADTDMVKVSLTLDPGMQKVIDGYSLGPPEVCARGVLEQVDIATRETHGGKLVDYTGLDKWEW